MVNDVAWAGAPALPRHRARELPLECRPGRWIVFHRLRWHRGQHPQPKQQ